MQAPSRTWWWVAGLWLCVAVGGVAALTRYAGSPGRPAAAPAAWPAGSAVTPAPGRPQLLMFAHPRCPCTRASVGELARLMAGAGRGVPARVLLSAPEGCPPGWADTDIARAAAAIPGVQVQPDPADAEAARFGVATSGQVLLYDAAGRLRFAGGITGARGHEGDNRARDALERALRGQVAQAQAPVFGCGVGAGVGERSEPWSP